MWCVQDVHSEEPPPTVDILCPEPEEAGGTLADGDQHVRSLVKPEVPPQPATGSPVTPPADDVPTCFICNLTCQEGLLSIFQADAVREQLKERLEGVLAITLEECQPTGQCVCAPCRNTLVTIETMAAGLRRAYHTTLSRHRCKYKSNFESGFSSVTSTLNSFEYYSGDVRQLQFHLTTPDGSSSPQQIGCPLASTPVNGVPKQGALKSELNRGHGTSIDVKTSRTEQSGVPQALYDDDTESEGEHQLEASVSQDLMVRKCNDEENRLRVQTGQKRKSSKPQRILAKEVGGSGADLSVHADSGDYDDDNDDVNMKEVTDDDDDFIPEQELDVKPVRRKRGRPKGSKNKRKLACNTKTIPAILIKPKKAKHRTKRDVGGVCDQCDKVFLSNYKLNRHKLTHTDERPYGCPQCNQQFKAKYHLSRHLQIHSGVRPHSCPKCSAAFRERHQLADHKLTHTGETPHACSQCEQRFQKASNLKQHMFDHTGLWPFKCSVCDAGFVREAELREHETLHNGAKPFSCDKCGKSFRLSNTLKVHMRRHTGVKPYNCKLCNARFAAANTLKEHLRTHSGVRKFLCDTCGAAFVHRSGLVQHAKTHLAVEDRKHMCPFCQRRFNELSLLKRHERIHTGERPYKCVKCGKSFRRPGELSMHHRYHSNDRRHICAACKKSFFTKSHLKRHQATHNNPFIDINGGVCVDMHYGPLYPATVVSGQSSLVAIPQPQSPKDHLTTAADTHFAADPVMDEQHELLSGRSATSPISMICPKQFLHVEHLTKNITKVHAPALTLDEQIASVAGIEEYASTYSTEDLGLPYMSAMPIIPQ